MCQNSEAYSYIQLNREDEKIHKVVKGLKGWTCSRVYSSDQKSHNGNMLHKKGLSAKQGDYVCSKCKNKEAISTKVLYKCKSTNEEKFDSHLNLYECAMPNYLKKYNVCTECAQIEKWCILILCRFLLLLSH